MSEILRLRYVARIRFYFYVSLKKTKDMKKKLQISYRFGKFNFSYPEDILEMIFHVGFKFPFFFTSEHIHKQIVYN